MLNGAGDRSRHRILAIETPIQILSGNAISYNLLLRIILEYFQPKLDRKNKNIQPGTENNIILIKQKECIPER